MRVHVELTLEVDADAWAYDYGLTQDEVPDDVRKLVLEHVRPMDFVVDVELRQ